ncbi:cupin domain-containing protein [Arenibacter sp. GZD96]|uniref:cupin domain-containing protein n=1 Tax=Aurantibrevibacter litoralis TaxID=3106030 RepID=UPI002AFFF191|nr:cupin domain-containing protein [Arenibacter sp. GZD-96]MEA1785223.1 cupin domain-containing protein [Arenibacter sp. GZD-96]
MYTINKQISQQLYNKLKVDVLTKTDTFEIISISLEKNTIFPEHTSPKDAQLLVLDGAIAFHCNGHVFHLEEQDLFNFPKAVIHWVQAKENSKFIIIR